MAANKNGSSKGVTSKQAGAKTTVSGVAKKETANEETVKSVTVAVKAANDKASKSKAAAASSAAKTANDKAAKETAKAAKSQVAAGSSATKTSAAVAKQAASKSASSKAAATSAATKTAASKSAPKSPAAKDAAQKTLPRGTAAKAVGVKAAAAKASSKPPAAKAGKTADKAVAVAEPVVSDRVTLIKASHPVKPKAQSAAAESLGSGAVLTVGDAVPEFEALNHAGELVKSSSLAGKPYVIYFYPKDDTPGCTTEACGFNEERAAFAERGLQVIGVSPDSPESHTRFRKKHGLEFTLLADTERKLVTRFGVWKLKQNYGREYWGVERSTFLVDKDGKIAQVWRGVRVAGHVPAVLEAASRL